ncbi:phage portal protein [Paenibacillus rhizosphaerae]|uniref:Phage portal protein n=1 Tax=Paenibacillus rhizosphaerae TaxID=297318 RepID=A0A1R1F1B0_9BACL|nr:MULTISPECIES: phage tail tube protein [Paenibacillus]MBJ9987396.1 phage tail tube protein [Paenibacillus sp. S28]OMF57854.1 phage portal protein [Paenibacillus rhizosphaerae]OXL83471.1 phage portal protein [Paenibacillus sp. SSG-1]
MVLDSTRVINGTYGYVYHDGTWLTNIKSAEANVEITKEEIKRAGTRWTAHKVTGLSGTGTISGYKVTSEFVERIGKIADDSQGTFITELILKLEDPESYGAYRVRLKGVTFDKIPLMHFEVGAIVEEELPFNFTGYELLDKITAE